MPTDTYHVCHIHAEICTPPVDYYFVVHSDVGRGVASFSCVVEHPCLGFPGPSRTIL